MNDINRVKKKFFELVSKNKLLFALAGSIVAMIAFFTPIFHVEYEMGEHYVRVSLWIFGLYEHSSFPPSTIIIELFGVTDQEKFGVALISIVSTILMCGLVLGTIITASNTLIRKRKKGIYSSRLLLYYSIGLFVAVNLYMFALIVNSFENADLSWIRSSRTSRMGAILFIIGSALILMGYTVKIKSLLKINSLYLAGSLINYGVIRLIGFSYWLNWVYPPIPQAALMDEITDVVIPAIIALTFALVIIVINFTLYRRAKKKQFSFKNEVLIHI